MSWPLSNLKKPVDKPNANFKEPKTRNFGMAPTFLDDVAKYYKQGMSKDQIAIALQCCRSSVHRALRMRGLLKRGY